VESSSEFFGVFLYLARLKTKTKPAVTNTASSSMPMIMPTMAPPDSFFSSFDFVDGTDDEVDSDFELEPSAGQDWPGTS
jgi:hypothetical protein